ncbi:MAG: exodeoxyribonuclease VII large subunit, partial [Hyphomonadaceae bacterium]
MDDLPESPPEAPGSNSPEMTVSELANALKRTVEDNYAFVRVRGELGRVILAKSGHLYFDIKDESATLNTIMWKGNASKLPFKPEEGLEVVAEGRLSTYPGRSNYQMIAERMRPAGLGALMQLLEERKKKLA